MRGADIEKAAASRRTPKVLGGVWVTRGRGVDFSIFGLALSLVWLRHHADHI
jgi:hypothetical protein